MVRTLVTLSATAALLALTACHGASGGGGGGVNDQNNVSLDSSNPVTQQESRTHALNLRAIPGSEGQKPHGPEVRVISRNGVPVSRVNVNTATAPQLMHVPGMSATIAAAIITNRPYRGRADLIRKVPNMTPQMENALEPYLAYSPAMGGGAGMAPKP